MAENSKRRVVFMGTPDFAASILRKIHASNAYDIAAVYTQPDKKKGRGLKTAYSAVKDLALAHDLPLFQPENFRSEQDIADLRNLNPDFLLVAAYGIILPQTVLDVPKIAPINVHASLLPAYRGAAPIQRAIMHGWQDGAETGVTIMKMIRQMDAGPIYAQAELPIGHDNSQMLEERLAALGGDLLLGVLPEISAGNLRPMEQDDTQVSYAPKLQKEDGRLDWNLGAEQIDALVRAVTPWPGARAVFRFEDTEKELPVTIISGKAIEGESVEAGAIYRHKNGLRVACGQGFYEIGQLCQEGRAKMAAAAFANGHTRIKNGICGKAKNFA